MGVAEDLEAMEGAWAGTYRLWLEPEVLRTESATTCTVRRVVDGRYALLDYRWTDLDGPQAGSMLFGPAGEGEWQMGWVDTWHTLSGVIRCTGTGPHDLLGAYGPDEEPWGWRTSIVLEGDALVVTAWNITPAGESAKATEATYRRDA